MLPSKKKEKRHKVNAKQIVYKTHIKFQLFCKTIQKKIPQNFSVVIVSRVLKAVRLSFVNSFRH